jgi:hypothetical protein
MIAGVAIQGDTQYAFSSNPDVDALEQLEKMARKGFKAFGFRVDAGVILVVGESLRTVIPEARDREN